MIVSTVTEAKAQLSSLLERVERGEEVVISRAGRPVAVLARYASGARRKPGRLRGKIRIAPDFDALPADLAEALGAGAG
jgi:prevent-host-death family protein